MSLVFYLIVSTLSIVATIQVLHDYQQFFTITDEDIAEIMDSDEPMSNLAVVYKYEYDLLNEIYHEGPQHERDVLIAWKERKDEISELVTDGWHETHELGKNRIISPEQELKEKDTLIHIEKAYARILQEMEERQETYPDTESLVQWRAAVLRSRQEALTNIYKHGGEKHGLE